MGQNNRTGAWGEALAAEYLYQKGYRILCTGYRSAYGEIDLIAQLPQQLVFVEVKLRRGSRFARAMEYVDAGKQERLRLTAACYLAEHPSQLPARFDVIEIYAPEGTATVHPEIHHLEDAFA